MLYLLIFFGASIVLTFLAAAIISLREEETLAARRFLYTAAAAGLVFVLAILSSLWWSAAPGIVLVSLVTLAGLMFFLPVASADTPEDETPRQRIDERDTMFSRRALTVGGERFLQYYSSHPEKLETDQVFRRNPGLLRPGTAFYRPLQFKAADATFETVETLFQRIDGNVAEEKIDVRPAELTAFLKGWAVALGAVSAGVTELRDYHLYSHRGRGDEYGNEIDKRHRYAFALTVEMDRRMVSRAPAGPSVMESAHQYLSSGAIAVQLATFLRSLGHSARAHIDGKYEVVCPLVARDAGLGEIGRMGILMTPRLGPRVRIAVVTTDIPLKVDTRKFDFTVIETCLHCSKCADVCPSDAIPKGERTDAEGLLRWQIDSEACFTFWTVAGTDCARCMAVCPYSHPGNLLHDLIRGGIRRSAIARRFAATLDDLYYGRRPAPLPPLSWQDAGRQDTHGKE